MQNYCDLSVANMLSGPRLRKRSQSMSESGEFSHPPSVTRERLGSMRYVETPNDCLLTPMRRGSQSQSQPDMNDVFMETPIGLGSSTRLEGRIQPDWDAIDKDLNYLEHMSKKADSIYSTQVKQGYSRMMMTLVQTERELATTWTVRGYSFYRFQEDPII